MTWPGPPQARARWRRRCRKAGAHSHAAHASHTLCTRSAHVGIRPAHLRRASYTAHTLHTPSCLPACLSSCRCAHALVHLHTLGTRSAHAQQTHGGAAGRQVHIRVYTEICTLHASIYGGGAAGRQALSRPSARARHTHTARTLHTQHTHSMHTAYTQHMHAHAQHTPQHVLLTLTLTLTLTLALPLTRERLAERKAQLGDDAALAELQAP